MANLTRLRLEGFWVTGSVVDPDEFEALDAMREMLINASDGSTHAPTVVIIIGGQGLRMTGPTDIDGDLDQDAASVWSMNGIVNFLDNSLLDMKVSSQQVFRTGSLLQILAGADVEIDGNVTWDDDNWPLLTSRSITRRGWRIGWTTYVGGTGTDPGTPRAWTKVSLVGGSGATAIQTREETSLAGTTFAIELTNLPPGATLNSVTIRNKGTAGDSGVNLPTYQLVRWLDTATAENMSSSTDDAHTGSDWLTDIVNTEITCNAHEEIDGAYRYAINVRAPYGTTAAAMEIYGVFAELTAEKIQL